MIGTVELRQLTRSLRLIENIALMTTASSTNAIGRAVIDECMENELAAAPSLVIASRQTAGRGRGANQWVSPAGGLYATLILMRARDAVGLMPLEIGVAVADFFRSLSIDARIKWPNDLLVDGKKIAGILIEAKSNGEGTYVVVGIGINLTTPDDSSLRATSIGAMSDLSRDEIVSRFIRSIDGSLADAPKKEETLARWSANALHRDGDAIEAVVGGEKVSGLWRGIDAFGRARIEQNGRLIEIAAGEIVQSEQTDTP